MTTLNKLSVAALFSLGVFWLATLLSGAQYLEYLLPGGLPLGNAFTAIGIIAFATVSVLMSKAGTVLRAISVISLVLAAMWLPASIVLAGNLALNFSSENDKLWFGLSLCLLGLIFLNLCWASIVALIELFKKPAKV